MSSDVSAALHIARAPARSTVAVQERETTLKYLLTLRKGETRPTRIGIWYRKLQARFGIDIKKEWSICGIFSTHGAAQAWIEWSRRQPGAHPKDRWQIIPVPENEGIPRDDFYQPDSVPYDGAEYEVVRKSDFDKLIHAMR